MNLKRIKSNQEDRIIFSFNEDEYDQEEKLREFIKESLELEFISRSIDDRKSNIMIFKDHYEKINLAEEKIISIDIEKIYNN